MTGLHDPDAGRGIARYMSLTMREVGEPQPAGQLVPPGGVRGEFRLRPVGHQPHPRLGRSQERVPGRQPGGVLGRE